MSKRSRRKSPESGPAPAVRRRVRPARVRAAARQPIPWKMIGFIVLLILFTAFTALNLEHRSDVNIGLYTFKQVPVFLTGLVAFILGSILVLPLALRRPPPGRPAPPAQLPPARSAEPDGAAAEPAEPGPPAEPTPAMADAAGEADQPAPPAPVESADGAPPRRRRWPLRRDRDSESESESE